MLRHFKIHQSNNDPNSHTKMIRKTSIWARSVSRTQSRSNVGHKAVGFYSIYIFISIIISCATTVDAYAYESEPNKKLMRTRGDIVLGGIFPMHENRQDNSNPCGDIKKEKGK